MSFIDRLNFREPGEPPQADEHATLSGDPELLDPDPEPGRQRRRTSAPRERSTTRRRPAAAAGSKTVTPQKVRDEIRDELTVYLTLAAATWGLSCEVCGDTAEQQVPKIAASMTDMIVRSDYLVEQFHKTSMLADLFKVLHATAPIVKAAAQHKSHHKHEHGEAPGANDFDRFAPYTG
jgi:hypothetical protein